MEKLIIASTGQYGYLTDTYKYCLKLKDKYEIIYICFDNELERIETNNVTVIYLKKKNSLLMNLIYINMVIVKENYKRKPKLIFSIYNPLNFISRILTINTRMILDIRTGDVNKNEVKRKKANDRIKFNSLFFKEITIISEDLAKLLGIKRYTILPLGADFIKNTVNKDLKEFNLLYIGVLSNREIYKTVDAVIRFNERHINKITYRIIGYFSNNNSSEAKKFFKKIKGREDIKYLGRKRHDELQQYFDISNIGVSFIPITEYYDCQPPTKTFEYLSQGLITIGTATKENIRIINEKNGMLCYDTTQSFYDALEQLYMDSGSFNSDVIKASIDKYQWDLIIDDIVLPIIEKI